MNIKDSLDYQYVIKVVDIQGNEKMVRIPIKGQVSDQIKKKEIKETDYMASAYNGLSAKGNNMDVYIPGGSFTRMPI